MRLQARKCGSDASGFGLSGRPSGEGRPAWKSTAGAVGMTSFHVNLCKPTILYTRLILERRGRDVQ
jgi:hypothetical protein